MTAGEAFALLFKTTDTIERAEAEKAIEQDMRNVFGDALCDLKITTGVRVPESEDCK